MIWRCRHKAHRGAWIYAPIAAPSPDQGWIEFRALAIVDYETVEVYAQEYPDRGSSLRSSLQDQRP